MFARLLARQGATAVVLANRSSPQLKSVALVRAFHTNPSDTVETQRLLDRWDECNKKYYGPERDTTNFPHPTIPETNPPTRLGFLPASWFEAFYEKTGVAGPYVFLFGLTNYAISKEILVQDHGFFELIAFYGAVYVIVKNWGPQISRSLTERSQKLNDKNWNNEMARTRSAFSSHSSEVDQKIAEEGRHKYVFDVQRENLDLQLEARYRERVAQVYSAVKRRLDYQVELVSTRKRFEQQHMVDWIVDSVVKGITPQQEKEAITSCIANLKNLAKTQPAL